MEFLTRFPVPRGEAPTPALLGQAAGWFPAVGLLLGLLPAAVVWGLRDGLHLAPHPGWALGILALQVLATGALHLDGVADLADGLGGGRGDRARALDIMRDPHLGSFGVVALLLILAGKAIAVFEILLRPDAAMLLLVAPCPARFSALAILSFFPSARPEGLAAAYRGRIGAFPWMLAITVAGAALGAAGTAAWIPAGAALVVAFCVAGAASVRLGGVTGDVVGASIEGAELAFLVAALHL
jgi:adenosylcobinamide-GDP ribazoletransferase